jgi:hypothetical protein
MAWSQLIFYYGYQTDIFGKIEIVVDELEFGRVVQRF